MIKPLSIASITLTIVLTASAQETNSFLPDKSGYNLFNPVPDNLMRELNADRPDKTESAYTVDAGHYQMEADFANYTYDDTGGTRTKASQVGDFNLKAGLFNNVDMQLVYDSYLNVNTSDRLGHSTTQSGFGDLTTRLKVNLWGNDGGQTAFALLPYVTFPTSTDNLDNKGVQGGIILPFAIKLPADFDLSLETAVSFIQNADNSDYHEEFIESFSLDHSFIGKLSGFVEFFSNFSTESHAAWVGTVDFGLEYLVTKNIQLDGGCNFGVTSATDQFNPFVGITWRF